MHLMGLYFDFFPLMHNIHEQVPEKLVLYDYLVQVQWQEIVLSQIVPAQIL